MRMRENYNKQLQRISYLYSGKHVFLVLRLAKTLILAKKRNSESHQPRGRRRDLSENWRKIDNVRNKLTNYIFYAQELCNELHRIMSD